MTLSYNDALIEQMKRIETKIIQLKQAETNENILSKIDLSDYKQSKQCTELHNQTKETATKRVILLSEELENEFLYFDFLRDQEKNLKFKLYPTGLFIIN